jgi:hypothetical protein
MPTSPLKTRATRN